MIQKDGVTGNEPGTSFRRVTFSQKTSFLEYNVLRVLILLYTWRIYGNSKKSISSSEEYAVLVGRW